MSPEAMPAQGAARPGAGWRQLAVAVGPGLVVMLADTEAGSVVSAAQSGAAWGYRLLLLQFALIPALFMAQELASRLGLTTRQGLAELALRRLGRWPAMLLLATLVTSCAGALVTELSGLAGVGMLHGIPAWQTSAVCGLGLLGIIWTGSYRSVERVAIAVGLCELAFIGLAWLAQPEAGQMARELFNMPFGDHDYLYLVAANIGTCVIPWAVFYQQSASIDKGLDRAHLRAARVETLLGAVLCQVITAAVLIAAASALRRGGMAGPLEQIGDIADAFGMAMGRVAGLAVFSLGLAGGALVAAIVVCLTAAWAFGEVFGLHHALGEAAGGLVSGRAARVRTPWFHAAVAVVVGAGCVVVGSGVNLLRLSIGLGVVNAVLLPVVLGFLFLLARRHLPAEFRLRGVYAAVVGGVFALTAGLGLYAGIAGAL